MAIEHRLDRPAEAKDRTLVRSLVRQSSDRHQAGISSLMIDPSNPDHLISTSRDNTIRTWNIAQSALADDGQNLALQVLRGHGNSIVDAAAWKDVDTGVSRLLTASADGTARLWRPDESAEIVALGGSTLDREVGAYGEVLSVSVGGNKGEQIMGISRDGVATIWDVSNQNKDASKSQRISLMEGHRFLTQSALFLKDVLVTISFDGTAAVWDTQTGSMVERWRDVGTTGVLAGAANGRWVITGYSTAKDTAADSPNLQILSLADAMKGRPFPEIQTKLVVGRAVAHGGKQKADPDSPSAVAISPNGNWGLVGTENGFLDLIDLQAKKVQPQVEAHMGSADPDSPAPEGVTAVAFLSDANAVTAGLDGLLKFWVIQDGKIVKHPSRKPFVHADGKVVHRVIGMVVSADGKRIATRLRQGKFNPNSKVKNPEFAQIWISDIDAEGVKPFAKLQPWGTTDVVGNSVSSVSIAADGQHLLATVVPAEKSASNQKQTILREWTLTEGNNSKSQDVLKSAIGFDFQQAFYLPGETDQIAILSDSLTNVRKRTARGGFTAAPVAAYGPTVALQACDVSRDGTLAVTVSDSLIPATDQPEGGLKGGARLQGEIRIWKVSGSVGKRVGGLLLDGAIRTVAMSPVDSNLILVGGNHRRRDGGHAAVLYRWNGKELAEVQSLGNHPQGIIRSRFSADGKRIVTASLDGQVEIFEQEEGSEKFTSVKPVNSEKPINLKEADLKLRLGDLIAVDLSDDGKWVVAADKSSAMVIDVQTGKPIVDHLIQGHSSDLTDVRFAIRSGDESPHRLWTTSLDGTVKFWGISESRQTDGEGVSTTSAVARPLLTLRGHQRGVLALAALPNGGVVTAGKDGRVILWPIAHVE